jgi:hypothetical protein
MRLGRISEKSKTAAGTKASNKTPGRKGNFRAKYPKSCVETNAIIKIKVDFRNWLLPKSEEPSTITP